MVSKCQTEAPPAIYVVLAICAPLVGAGRPFSFHVQGDLGLLAETLKLQTGE